MVRRIEYGLIWAVPPLLFALLWRFGGPRNPGDVAVVEWLQRLRLEHGLTPLAIAITEAGSFTATVGLTLLASACLLILRELRRALLLAPSAILVRFLADIIKDLAERPRPALALHPVVTHSASFPSGHAANSMAAFLALALFAAPQRWRKAAVVAAVIMSMLVGLTRPLLGVHWPSDVLAGWLLAAFVLAGVFRLSGAQQQHQIVGRHRPAVDQR